MALFLGHRTFNVRRKAFRTDYCLHCDAVTYAVQIRSWSFLTILFIPLVPLGARTRWQCARCGKQPDKREATSLAYKIAVLIVFALFLWASFVADPAEADPVVDNAIRIGLGVLIVATMVAIVRHRPVVNEDPERIENILANLSPLTVCPFCEQPLQLVEGAKRCVPCKLVYRERSMGSDPASN